MPPATAVPPKNWKRQKISALIKSRAEKRSVESNMNGFDSMKELGIVVPTKETTVAPIIKISTSNSSSSLPMSDERNLLPKKFLDCFNILDMDLLLELLKTHCTSDVILINKYDGEKNPLGPDLIEVFYSTFYTHTTLNTLN